MIEKIHPEVWEQEQFFKWVYSNQIKVPELQLCEGSMNGVKLGPQTKAKIKAQGLRKGFTDINLPVERGGCYGLRIELKRVKGGRVEPEQKRIHGLLRAQNRKVVVCKGWVDAVKTVIEYLELDINVYLPNQNCHK